MTKIFIGTALTALLITGCATAPENLPRPIDPIWQLEPETTTQVTAEVEQGDIVMSGTATALATHSIVRDGKTVGLTVTDSRRGKLYCDFKVMDVCYEDRDANAAFDYRWKVYRNPRAPGDLYNANSPEELDPQVSFKQADDTDEIILTQQLGLLYNGPVEGRANDDFIITNMLGEFMLGWHKGKDAPRDPSGLGWNDERAFPTLLIEDVVQEVTVLPINMTYKIIKATVEGDLEIMYQMKPAKNVDLSSEFDYDIQKEGTLDEDGNGPKLDPLKTAP